MKNSNLINMYFIFEHKTKDIFSETLKILLPLSKENGLFPTAFEVG